MMPGKLKLLALALAAAMLAGGAGCTVLRISEEHQAEIEGQMRQELLEGTNLSPVEAGIVWHEMKGEGLRISPCQRYRDPPETAGEGKGAECCCRREIAYQCRMEMGTENPLPIRVVGWYRGYFDPDDPEGNMLRSPPLTRDEMGEMEIQGFGQGILKGETRQPGAWRLEE